MKSNCYSPHVRLRRNSGNSTNRRYYIVHLHTQNHINKRFEDGIVNGREVNSIGLLTLQWVSCTSSYWKTYAVAKHVNRVINGNDTPTMANLRTLKLKKRVGLLGFDGSSTHFVLVVMTRRKPPQRAVHRKTVTVQQRTWYGTKRAHTHTMRLAQNTDLTMFFFFF